MKTFLTYLDEYLNYAGLGVHGVGGASTGRGMGQYVPMVDLNAQSEKEIKKSDLDQVEKYADRLFASLGIDVEFTRHFLDRVNDKRNVKQITPAELTRLFKQSFKKHGKKIAQLGPDAEAVINDMKTDINMPFVLNLKGGELELVAKTVMRKKDFKTSGPKMSFENFINEVRAKQAVAGGKVQKLVTAHGLKFKGKVYKEIDMELVKINNSTEMVTFNIIHPKEIFGNETNISFKALRRGPFMATDTSKINELSLSLKDLQKSGLNVSRNEIDKLKKELENLRVNVTKKVSMEVLDKDADAGDYIDDFAKSDAPQFKGKSKEKRKDMAVAAYLSKKDEAVSPAQQAAIAISKKERGEKPKKEAVISEKIEGLVNKAEKSGMPYSILKKVYDRGMAAYKTGHRPGTTAQQWAFARVNSFVTKSSGTWGKADKDLAKQVRGESVETESLWDNIRKKKARIAKGSGEKMRSKGDKGAPTPNQIKRASEDLNEWGEVTEKDDKSGKELNNPTRGDVKKYKVYVRNKKGNVVKVEFGDPNMSIKRDDPARRKAFRARHNCDQKKDKTTAGYWSCKFWSTKSVTDLMKG